MELDKSVVKRISKQCGAATYEIEVGGEVTQYILSQSEMIEYSNTLHAIGVADERERIAKIFDEAGWHPYAELIRNSSNDREDCDSKSDK